MTSATLNSAIDGQLLSIEAISAADASAAVTISLATQTEAFTLTGSAYADTLTSGAGADRINAGSGDDMIIGFAGADTVDGGAGNDALVLRASAPALNSATNEQLVNVEAVSAAAATSGVAISLTNQTERMALTGSAYADTLAGGSGADNINAASGADSIDGFAGADTVDGGAGTDMLWLNGTSTDLNNASNAQLINVEAISVSAHTVAVEINLAHQTEGFTLTSGEGADTLTGGAGANVFDYTNLATSLVDGYDTIKNAKTTDNIKIGHTLAGLRLVTVTGPGSGNLSADLTTALTSNNFVAGSAAVVSITGTAPSSYLIINDETAGFQSARDGVIKLVGAGVLTMANFRA